MKSFVLIVYLSVLFFSPLFAEKDQAVVHYRDSIMEVVEGLPRDTVRLAYLENVAYCHQYVPLDYFFAIRLYAESLSQKNLFYENLGAYYVAGSYDRRHDPDTLAYWVDKLEELAFRTGTYDYYLERKAAIGRALASKRMIEKAIYSAKEVLEESKRYGSNNGEIAAYNTLACAYAVSRRPVEALGTLLKARDRFTPFTKEWLKIDVLSRLASCYGESEQNDLRLNCLSEMKQILQQVMDREPEARNNWTNMAIDCEIKYILYFLNTFDFVEVQKHIEQAKALLSSHVDPVFWLNVQLVQLQYFSKIKEYDKSIALVDEVTPIVLKDYVSTFGLLIQHKAMTQKLKGDIDGAIQTRRYLIRMQDSLNNAFSVSQLEQVKDIYHIDELLLEKQKITNMNLVRLLIILVVLTALILLFYVYTRYLSKKIAESEKKSAKAADQAEADNTAKEHLRNEISHDIRTPLNAVVGFAELMAEGGGNLDQKSKSSYSRIIQENAEQLLDYVNHILELSRLESGKIKYIQEVSELIGICRMAVEIAGQVENNRVKPVLETVIESLSVRTDGKAFLALLKSMLISIDETENEVYRTKMHVAWDENERTLIFRVANTPLAKGVSDKKTPLIRNEINAHFIRCFGGTYEIYPDDAEGPTIVFTYPVNCPD